MQLECADVLRRPMLAFDVISCGKAKFIATGHAADGGSCLGGGRIRIVNAQRAMFF